MASTYTTNLGIEKIGTGEQSGTWGDTTNTNFDILDEAVNGIISITLSSAGSSGSPTALPITDGASSNGRNKFIEFVDGGDLGGTAYVQLTPNDAEKIVHIRNSLSSSRSVIVFQGTYNASNDFEIVNGADVLLKFNGGGSGATVTDVNVDLTVTGATIATADINGGAIDGTVIGGASAAAITATTITGTTITASTAVVPDASDGATLGSTSLEWSDLYLADGAVVFFGDDQDITLTHVADTGLTLKHANTGDDKFPTFLLATGDTDIAADDKLGVINFQAPDEGAGTDAILVAAGIEAVSEGDFSASSNATSLVFKTGASEAAAEKMRVDSAGNVGIGESNPSFKLDVERDAGSATTGDYLNIHVNTITSGTPTTLASGIIFDVDDTECARVTASAERELIFKTAGNNERMRVDNAGLVGIGTSSPDSALVAHGVAGSASRIHISSGSAGQTSFDGSGSGLLLTAQNMNTSAKFTPAIQFGSKDVNLTTTNPKVGAAINGVASETYDADTDGGMELAFYTTPNNPGTGQTTTERMRIDNAGNVGIGTNNPSAYYATELVVASSDEGGITLAAVGTTHTNYVAFADGTSSDAPYRGQVRYDHNDDSMSVVSTGYARILTGSSRSEALRVDSSGNLLVAKTSASFTTAGPELRANGQINAASTADFLNMYSTSASAYRFYVTNAGTINATSTSISAISDQSLKENIRDLDKGLETINALQPRRFDWKNGDGNDIMGFVAQEVQVPLPEIVHDQKYNESENKLAVKMGDMIPSMVKAIQELSAQVTELKAEVAALKGA